LIELKKDKKDGRGYPQSHVAVVRLLYFRRFRGHTHVTYNNFLYASTYAWKPNDMLWSLTDSSPKAQDKDTIRFHA